jgi:UDP-N-acetylmuramate dehydrogenase
VIDALRWAGDRKVAILGGGSNLVVADAGFDGLVIEMAQRGIEERGDVVRVLAGEPWDPLVEWAVSRSLAGLECLSGIPGRAGATPIQNVGAYGQEVSETIVSVRAIDRTSMAIVELDNKNCEFAYRDSMFKRVPDRWVVVSVDFALRKGGAPSVRYAELEKELSGRAADLETVRSTVLRLRRAKSMVIDPADENRRSAGSFFTNPIVDDAIADAIPNAPRWPAGEGKTKLAAGWLIEQAGIHKGLRMGNVGVSSKHALALVHHGGGSSAELLALAERVRTAVRDRFGITLVPEPVLLGL